MKNPLILLGYIKGVPRLIITHPLKDWVIAKLPLMAINLKFFVNLLTCENTLAFLSHKDTNAYHNVFWNSHLFVPSI